MIFYFYRNFDESHKKHCLYKRPDCMNKFGATLNNQVLKMVNFKRKKMLPSTNEKLELHKFFKKFVTCVREKLSTE